MGSTDIAANQGWVNGGIDADTAAFAVREHPLQYREWKARATAELARAYKVWPPRIPEHVWRDAYISGNSPEEGATAAEVYDRNSRPVKLKSSAITAGSRAIE